MVLRMAQDPGVVRDPEAHLVAAVLDPEMVLSHVHTDVEGQRIVVRGIGASTDLDSELALQDPEASSDLEVILEQGGSVDPDQPVAHQCQPV